MRAIKELRCLHTFQAPMSDCWDHITIGMKVEVEKRDPDAPNPFQPSFWVASVLRISGYHALLRYEGFGQDGSKDFWMSVCSEKLHPVGYCITKGKPLIPPTGEIELKLCLVLH